VLNNLITGFCGILLDRLAGDPRWIPHPVIAIGKLISWLDAGLNRECFTPRLRRVAGIITVLLVVGFTYGLTWGLLELVKPFFWLFWMLNSWLMATTIAGKGLSQAGQAIFTALKANHLESARQDVGKIVGRDTTALSQTELIRAAVESIAENTVDGVIAPVCFGLLGGAPLAMAYRAVNTLDSMLGYKNQRYLHFGWAAARLDDLANFLPARLCGILMVGAAFLLRFEGRSAWRIMRRDAGKHPSPNGGWPEAAVAGALGIRLGGENIYHGKVTFRNFLGEAHREMEPEDIRRTGKMLNAVTGMMTATIAIAVVIIVMSVQ
jgi:adenosylcobinamide-phosphate synthase